MKLKTVKRMNACILSAAMVLSGVTIIPPATVSAAANNEINYALSATATVSDQETNYWPIFDSWKDKNGYKPSKHGLCSRFLFRNDMCYIMIFLI